jgi:hypothetical protein
VKQMLAESLPVGQQQEARGKENVYVDVAVGHRRGEARGLGKPLHRASGHQRANIDKTSGQRGRRRHRGAHQMRAPIFAIKARTTSLIATPSESLPLSYAHVVLLALAKRLRRNDAFAFTRADAERDGAERAMGAGVAVAADEVDLSFARWFGRDVAQGEMK